MANRSIIGSNLASAEDNINVEPSGNCQWVLSGDFAMSSKDTRLWYHGTHVNVSAGGKAKPDGSEPKIGVNQLRLASQFTVGIQVGDNPVNGVVDSAAEVTIISDKVYRALKAPSKKLRVVKLATAGRQKVMDGFMVQPVRLKIGNRWYSENVHIAPIEQILLGIDILFYRGKSVLDMTKRIIVFDDQGISLDIGTQGRTSHHRTS